MNTLRLFFACSLLLASQVANAATLRLAVNGQLGDGVLSVHDGFEFALFSGFVEFDLDDRMVQSGSSTPFYNLVDWSITVDGTSSDLLLEGSGETFDNGTLSLNQSASINRVTLLIDEDISTPGVNELDRTLRLYFDPDIDLDSDSRFEDISTLTFEPSGSLLQFSTSQVPMTVASASISAVPVPAAAWLFGSALLGLGVLQRREA